MYRFNETLIPRGVTAFLVAMVSTMNNKNPPQLGGKKKKVDFSSTFWKNEGRIGFVMIFCCFGRFWKED